MTTRYFEVRLYLAAFAIGAAAVGFYELWKGLLG